MTKENMMQETLFSFLGEEDPTPVQASNFQSATKPVAKKKAAGKPTSKTVVEEKMELTVESTFYYGGEHHPITDYFNQEEIEEGIRITEGDKAGERRPITGEDIRKRMEEEYRELIEEYTHTVFSKEKNMVLLILQARKKGIHIERISAKKMSFLITSENTHEKWIPRVRVKGKWALIADEQSSTGLVECNSQQEALNYARRLKANTR